MALPRENLDNKTFDDFVKEALKYIPLYAPGWTDHNLHDPGIMFIELFAWLAEMQLYCLDTITDDTYIKFLKLLGNTTYNRYTPATAYLSYAPGDTVIDNIVTVEKKATAYAHNDKGETVVFTTMDDVSVVRAAITALLYDNRVTVTECEHRTQCGANTTKQLYFYPFGKGGAPVAPDFLDPSFYIGFDNELGATDVTLYFINYNDTDEYYRDAVYDTPDIYASVSVVWEYYDGLNWLPLTVVDGTNALTKTGVVTITIPQPLIKSPVGGKDEYWIRCRLSDGAYVNPPAIEAVLLNTVKAYQCEIIEDVVYTPTGLPGYAIDLDHTPVIARENVPELFTGDWSVIKVEHLGECWEYVDSFDASRPDDRHFTLDFTTGRLCFGNGLQGKIPGFGNPIRVTYATGKGAAGNVPSHTITNVTGTYKDKGTVCNYKAATGGKDAPGLQEAVEQAGKSLKTITRAITAADYEQIVLNTPDLGVARVKALPGYDPFTGGKSSRIISVIVIPETIIAGLIPDNKFLYTIKNILDKYRMLGTEVLVIPPEYVEISIKADIAVKERYVSDLTIKRVKERLNEFLHPLTGSVHEEGWEFGRPVYLSEIYELIDKVEGVDYVKHVALAKRAQGEPASQEYHGVDAVIPEQSIVYAGSHEITSIEQVR